LVQHVSRGDIDAARHGCRHCAKRRHPMNSALRYRFMAYGILALATAVAVLCPEASLAQSATTTERALREMQIHKIPELGLEIWVENQPAWEAELSRTSHHHSSFVVQSPDSFHPPTVMTYASWPKERVAPDMFP